MAQQIYATQAQKDTLNFLLAVQDDIERKRMKDALKKSILTYRSAKKLIIKYRQLTIPFANGKDGSK